MERGAEVKPCPGYPDGPFEGNVYQCRENPYYEPDEGTTWEEACERCQFWRERFAELRGEMKREDMALANFLIKSL